MNSAIARALNHPKIKEPFEIHRQRGNGSTGGQWVETAVEVIEASGSVQPSSSEVSGDIDNSTGGYIQREVITIYTSIAIIGADDNNSPDTIKWNRKLYEVNSVKDWRAFGFYKVTAQMKAFDDGTNVVGQLTTVTLDIEENNIVTVPNVIPTAITSDGEIFNPAGERIATIPNADLTILENGVVQIESENDYCGCYLKFEYGT